MNLGQVRVGGQRGIGRGLGLVAHGPYFLQGGPGARVFQLQLAGQRGHFRGRSLAQVDSHHHLGGVRARRLFGKMQREGLGLLLAVFFHVPVARVAKVLEHRRRRGQRVEPDLLEAAAAQRPQQRGHGRHGRRLAQHPHVVRQARAVQHLKVRPVARKKLVPKLGRARKYVDGQVRRGHFAQGILHVGFHLPGLPQIGRSVNKIGHDDAHRARFGLLKLQDFAQHGGQLGAQGGVFDARAHGIAQLGVGGGPQHAGVFGRAFLHEVVGRGGAAAGLLALNIAQHLRDDALKLAARLARRVGVHEAAHPGRGIHEHVYLYHLAGPTGGCVGRTPG